MDPLSSLSLALGSAWASGINLYASVLILGIMGSVGAVHLPAQLQILENPIVLLAAGVMYCIEFFADKVPGVDTVWDSIHTFIRIPAGAILAVKAVGPVDPGWTLAAGLVGGTLAAGSHATKAGTRVLINASPEPFSNIVTSLAEDALVIGGLWTALQHPIVFLVALLIFVLFMAWIIPKLWRAIRRVFCWIFGRSSPPAPSTNA